MLGFRWPMSPTSWRRTLSRRYNNNNTSHNYHNGDSNDDDDVQAQRLLVKSKPVEEQVRYIGFGIGGAGNMRR